MINAEQKAELYAEFAAGRGKDAADRRALGKVYGVTERTIAYHGLKWLTGQMAIVAQEFAAEQPADPIPTSEVDAPEQGAAASEQSQGTPPMPTAGGVYEAIIARAEVDYALAELVDFCLPGTSALLRGKISVTQVLRTGYCRDTRDFLQPGDPVAVKVLSVTPPSHPNSTRWNVALSTKQAPPHPQERAPLEDGQQAPRWAQTGPDAPISVRGADVARELGDEANPPPVKQPAPKRGAPPTAPGGLCATCAHGLDRMCPYTDWFSASEIVPSEDMHERHKDARIVFGPRLVVECSLYRPVGSEK